MTEALDERRSCTEPNAAPVVERIASIEQLESVRDEWDAIQSVCPWRHVLLDHRWVCSWWRHIGREHEMHVLRVRRGAETIGFVPLMVSRGLEVFPTRETYVLIAADFQYVRSSRVRKCVPIRRLGFPLSIATGDARSHFLLTDESPEVYDAVMGYASCIASRWNLLVLEGLTRESGQAGRILAAASRIGLRTDGRSRATEGPGYERTFLFVDLPDSMEAYLAARSASFRKKLRQRCANARRDVEAIGTLGIDTYRGDTVEEGMDRLFVLETRSWKAQGNRGRPLTLRLDDRLPTFYRSVARAYAETDEAQVIVVTVADEPISAIFTLERDGRAIGVLTYLDEAFARQVTAQPMFRHLVQTAIGRSLRELDLNGNTTFLRKWSNGSRVLDRVVLYNRRPYSRILRTLSRGARMVYRLRSHRAARREAESTGGQDAGI